MLKKQIIVFSFILLITNLLTWYLSITFFHWTEKVVETKVEIQQVWKEFYNEKYKENQTYNSCMKEYNLICSENTIKSTVVEKKDISLCDEMTSDLGKISCKDDYYYTTSLTKKEDKCSLIQNEVKKTECTDVFLREKIVKENSEKSIPFDIKILKCSQIQWVEQKNNCKQELITSELNKLNKNATKKEELVLTPCEKLWTSELVEKCKTEYSYFRISTN